MKTERSFSGATFIMAAALMFITQSALSLSALPVAQALPAAGGTQTITFPALSGRVYGDADFAPGATASSGLAVTYTSANPSVATIVSGNIHITGSGTSTITARQAGNASWAPAADVSQDLIVGKGAPVITWAAPKAITYGKPLTSSQFKAKANVAGSFAYSPAIGTILPAGIHTLTATFTPTDTTRYNTAQKSVSLIVNKAAAKVTLVGLKQTYNGQPRPVTATTSPAGLNVSITYGGAAAAPVNAGSYAVTATVVDANATGVKTGTLKIAKGSQTITFAPLPAMTVGDADLVLTASASSGLAVGYASAAPAVATIVGGSLHAVGLGKAVITASQPGNTNWNAAPSIRQTLTVQTEDQNIRAFYAAMKSRLEAHDETGFFALFAPEYLHAGQYLADQFGDGPGMLDAVKTFTFNITGITVTGGYAMVAGSASITFNNGDPAETWAEPDTTNDSPGIGWLCKTPAGWRVAGDQKRAGVSVRSAHNTTPGEDSYSLQLTTESPAEISGVSVSGPGIATTDLEDNPEWGGFTAVAGNFTSAQRPPVGSVYTFVVGFGDATQAIYQDSVSSWLPTAPVITVTPGTGTATINWTNVQAAVPNAASYGVRIHGAGGESDSIWRGSEELPLTQTSIAFNADGSATAALLGGRTYTAVVTIFDRDGNYAFRTVDFTMPLPPAPAGFSLIPAGSFSMGDAFGEGSSDELPVHTVQVSAFYMAKYEVTKALWDEVRTWGLTHGYTDLPEGGGKAANHPVQSITWYDVVKWCNARSEMETLTPCYTLSGAVYRTTNDNAVVCNWNTNGYRLPSEAEWEKAARGGLSGKRFPWGDAISHDQANFWNGGGETYQSGSTGTHPLWSNNNDGNLPYTSPVGSFAANGYGLYDMTGNVWEWCWDWYGSYTADSQTDPLGEASGSSRVFRGGYWNDSAFYCRVAFRGYGGPGDRYITFGFRPTRSSVP